MIRKLLFTGRSLIASGVGHGRPAAAIPQRRDEGRQYRNAPRTASSPLEVRALQCAEFGNTLVSDHTQARAQAADLASSMDMRTPMRHDARGALRSIASWLRHLRGRRSTGRSSSYMINDHQKDIAKFRGQARSGDRRTAALARAQLPVLAKHLRIAQSLRV